MIDYACQEFVDHHVPLLERKEKVLEVQNSQHKLDLYLRAIVSEIMKDPTYRQRGKQLSQIKKSILNSASHLDDPSSLESIINREFFTNKLFF